MRRIAAVEVHWDCSIDFVAAAEAATGVEAASRLIVRAASCERSSCDPAVQEARSVALARTLRAIDWSC